ncbi:MAG: DUF4115 domain-containing protein [Peptococcaceae bacterium]|nr:DUF4115 domain-containing protein [Peptococcaceae bacterium]
MKTLGEILLEARLRLGLSLVDCVEFTKISKQMIRHMENDEWKRLHDRATAEKLLRRYADFLRLNEAAVLHKFNMDYPEGELIFEEDPEEKTERLRRENKLKKKKLRLNLILLAAVALLVIAGTLIYNYVSKKDPAEPPDQKEEMSQSGSPGPDEDQEPAPGLTIPVSDDGKLELTLNGLSDCWIRVGSDGKTLKEGLLSAGETYSCTAEEVLSLRLGSAGGVEVAINGVKLESPGGVGQVVNQKFGRKNGVVIDLETGRAAVPAGLG